MIVVGNIGTLPTKKVSPRGKEFYEFRLAESFGRKDDPNRSTVWYTVRFFAKDDLSADLLARGQLVEVRGKLDARAYKRKDVEPETLAVDLVIITSHVAPKERAVPVDEGQHE